MRSSLSMVENGFKKKNEKQRLKTDSYVFETNIHFPTDLNLAWDAARKSIELSRQYAEAYGFSGWRKASNWKSRAKSAHLRVTRVNHGGGKNKEERLKKAVENYLSILREVEMKVKACVDLYKTQVYDSMQWFEIDGIELFLGYLTKHIDLVERRLIKGEVIPHEEKMFSLFETHSEWINKGKARPNVELGHRLLVTSDQHGFIVDHKVMEGTTDPEELPALIDRLKGQYAEEGVESHSFDKGFYSASNKQKVAELAKVVVMPKKGKLNQTEKAEQSTKEFKKLRHAHSAVESDINCLEHHGLDRCPDKGLKNYKRYVALGVLAYNLHKVGNSLMGKKRGQKPKARAA